MANGRYSHSRSPIRAVAAASHTVAGTSTPQPRPWGDIALPKSAPDHSRESGDYGDLQYHALACPECGTALRLQLLATQAARQIASSSTRVTSHEPLVNFDDTVDTFKRDLLTRALKENGGVMTRAAKAVGLKYTTFVAMAHRLGVGETAPVAAEG